MRKIRRIGTPIMLIHKVLIPKKEHVDQAAEFPAGRPLFKDRDTGDGIVPITLNDFIQHCTIFGLTGTGKTYFLSAIIDHFRRYAAGMVGVMVINYGKERQEAFFAADTVLRFGEPGLRIPYFLPPASPALACKVIQQTSQNIVASMGMKYVVNQILYTVMLDWWQQRGALPATLDVLFKSMLVFIDKHPYGPEAQANLVRATENRVLPFIKNQPLIDALRLGDGDIENGDDGDESDNDDDREGGDEANDGDSSNEANGGDVPEWFNDWLDGKMVFIDLSACDKYAKQICTYSIFQMVRSRVPVQETHLLHNLIVIDEAHQVLEKAATNDPDDADHIAMVQIEAIFSQLLKEFRSKGVGIIIADQQPSSLMQCAYSQASLRVLFRLSYPCNTLFSSDPEITETLLNLGNREALILNGGQGKYEIIKTLDIRPPK